MYLYLYDSFLGHKKYGNLLARIETRLTDLGIGGKIFRLSPLRNVEELIADEVRNGAKTIVVVGNDKSFAEIINIAAKFEVTLGVIPVGPDNKIAQALGVTSPEDACNILAARKIERVDLGKANGTYFLSSIKINGNEVTIDCENKFTITSQGESQISICNFRPLDTKREEHKYFDPQDGFLEILVQKQVAGFIPMFKKTTVRNDTIIPFKTISISSRESLPVVTDGQRVLKTPVQIKIVPKKLRLIVGKNRQF